ncbi:putative transcription factor B3-Domain family [Helianthus annuus]|nr:putative transcription factor B3-Domain family [Helianthus annuus]KAJ0912158.1 putative transcription factor B3-Domain family [Helianthus annuus]
MENYFKNDPLDCRFTIRFQNKLVWTVYIVRRFGTNYSIVDWIHISNDLRLETGDFVIFELLGYNDFSISVFHKDGLHRIHQQPLRVQEVIQVQQHGILDGIVESPVRVGDFYELKWVLTNRFIFPKDFAANVNLADMEYMTAVSGNGFSNTLALRFATSNKKLRYAFRGWTKFMRQAGLEDGYLFLLRYYFNSATLMITYAT